MPVEMEQGPDRPTLRVVAAPVIELAYCCYVAERAALKLGLGGAPQARIRTVIASQPELMERLAAFWATDGYYEWAESIILAHRMGTLFSEPEQFLAGLDKAAAERYEVPELPSEDEHARTILQGRLDRLAASAELRTRYVSLLTDFWAVLKPHWAGGMEAAAGEMVSVYRQRLARVSDVREVLPVNHFARRATHAELVASAIERGEAVLTPLALGGVGMALFALPGLLLIGVGPEAEKRQAERREGTERAATRFKVLSDPTRLSILTSFCGSPFSITELADFFDLSQPTISVHVKMLREAGLVEGTKVRGQTFYRASREQVSAYVEAALAEAFNS